jgi:hypothetical protein
MFSVPKFATRRIGTPDCSLYVVTSRIHLTNTDPASPADYLAAIMTWVDARLRDS